jgi:hypothetical protein
VTAHGILLDMEKEHRGLPRCAAVPSTGDTLRANAVSDCIMPISDRTAAALPSGRGVR